MNNFKKYSLLFTFVIMGFFAFCQTPTPLSSLQRSASPRMIMSSNDSRYASYQFFTPFWGDTVRAIINANPQWLGTFLPSGAVNINASGNNLIFTNGGINSWATDTTAGNWIMQYFLSPASSAGSGQIGARNYVTGKRYGLQFDGATGTRLQSNTDIYLQDKRVQDTLLTPGYRYFPSVAPDSVSQQTGVITWTREDSINLNKLTGIFAVRDSQVLTSRYRFYRDSANTNGNFAFGVFPSFPNENNPNSRGFYMSNNDGVMLTTGGYDSYFIVYPKSATGAAFDLYGKGNFGSYYNYGSTSNDAARLVDQVTRGNNQSSVTTQTAIGIIGTPNGFSVTSNRIGVGNLVGLSVLELVSNINENTVTLYDDKYRFPNKTINNASNKKTMMTWTGNGSTVVPAMEPTDTLFAANAYTVTDTTQYPAASTRAVRKLQPAFGIPNTNYSLQGDSVIVFPVAGVYEVSYSINSYDATGAAELATVHRVVNQAGTMSSTAQLRQRSGLSSADQSTLTGTFLIQFTGSAPFSTKIVINNIGANLLITDACQINVKRIY